MDALLTSLKALGLSERKATKIKDLVSSYLQKYRPEQCWQLLLKTLLKFPFPIQLAVYKSIYPQYENQPGPVWFPDEKTIKTSNLAKIMNEKGIRHFQQDYSAFHRLSIQRYPEFWGKIAAILNIQFDEHYSSVVDVSKGVESPTWFPGAKLNIVNSCLQAKRNATAIIAQSESGKIRKLSYDELDKLSSRVANSIQRIMPPGSTVAIIMPMIPEAVAIFLGVIKAGCIVAAIPDSFSVEEIAHRLRTSQTKMVFCQDHVIRAGKALPLYQRLMDANAPFTVAIPSERKISLQLRPNDQGWAQFLSADIVFTPHSAAPDSPINILFSSGTTGEPKIIPWNHITPLKCASDAFFHHNLQPNDVFCWPTNLGWMMGPWLIFACLLNKATLALYEGSPNTREFGKFVQHADVTHLGVVPTLVRTWRNSHCMEGLRWSRLKMFTSTGERSSIDDMLYLMSLADYRPIIEYCGGTEVAGAYITGTVLQPAAPAAFTTPALGLDFAILDEQGQLTQKGEAAIIPPSVGLSTELLNRNHHEAYYANMPRLESGQVLRRHGDEIEHCPNGYYRLLGRADDTMKLGGIKISSAEIESLLNSLPGIYETAAIGVNGAEGGPTQLVIYAVLKPNLSKDLVQIKVDMQRCIKEHLNPLFKIDDVIIVPALPRTASNKVLRKVLRERYNKEKKPPSAIG